jgi:tripeptide aminopeptidase
MEKRMVNVDRLKRIFLDLVQIDSHSREEKNVADYIKEHLEPLGGVVTMDDAAEKIGGNCGNLLVRFHGPLNNHTEPLLFCAHMDTVVPGKGVRPIEDNGVVRSSGDTILGADDKSGIAAIMEMLHILKENSIPFGELEILFTVAEEVGLFGARNFDTGVLKSQCGYFLDTENVSDIGVAAPAAYRMTYRVFGKEAHAGLAPEKGISAIVLAAKAIDNMPLGRIDDETTANIGVIEGGQATNIITPYVSLRGEARSHNDEKLEAQVQAMRDAFQKVVDAASIEVDGKEHKARFEESSNREYKSFHITEDSPTYQLVVEAGKELGINMQREISGGGSDANIFNEKGIESVIIGTGMQDVHTVKEHIRIDDMVTSANLIVNMVRRHSQKS